MGDVGSLSGFGMVIISPSNISFGYWLDNAA